MPPRRLRGDLDNIVLKALRKEPLRRYDSVDALADDIRHTWRTPGIGASGFLELSTRQVHSRNPVGVGVSLTALTLLAFAMTSRWQAGAFAAQRDRARKRSRCRKPGAEYMIDLFRVPDPMNLRQPRPHRP